MAASNDPNTGNNTGSHDVTVAVETDVLFNAASDGGPVNAGESVQVTIPVANNGPSDAAPPVVTFDALAGT